MSPRTFERGAKSKVQLKHLMMRRMSLPVGLAVDVGMQGDVLAGVDAQAGADVEGAQRFSNNLHRTPLSLGRLAFNVLRQPSRERPTQLTYR